MMERYMAQLFKAKKILYEGKSKDLVNGRYYTVKELAEISGQSSSTIRYRLNGSSICTDEELILENFNAGTYRNRNRQKTTMTLSQKWLKKKLI